MTGILLAMGCSGEVPDVVPPDTPWEIAADRVPGGVMLSAWTDPVSDEVLIVGGQLRGASGTLWRYDGAHLCYEEGVADEALWWIHGRPDGDWVAVGAGGVVVRQIAGIRTRDDVPTSETQTLFGAYDDGTDLWVVSGDVSDLTGEVWRQPAGGSWEQVATMPNMMFKVWGEWFVGAGGAYRWDGAQLVADSPDGDPRLMTVRGSGDRAWAVGDGLNHSEAYVSEAGAWSSVPLEARCLAQGLNGVWADPGEDVWVAGFFGQMARWDGTTWECPDVPLTDEHFHAAWRWHDETLFLGGNLFAFEGNHGTVGRHGGVDPMTVGACE